MTCGIRFCENNFLESFSNFSVSSYLSGFGFSNAQNTLLSKKWIPSGNFQVINKKIYINDGANKEATITGTYSTPELFAAAVQTALNSVSSSWTCSYTRSDVYKFTITHSTSATLRLSQSADSIWELLGFTTSTDLVGTSFQGNRQINHSSEWALFDFTGIVSPKFLAVIGDRESGLDISSTATVKLQGNNLNSWDAPPFEISLTPDEDGILYFLDSELPAYRFFRLYIEDRTNPRGPNALKISYIYLGDFVAMTNKNIQTGFSEQILDPSDEFISDDGTQYFDEKIKKSKFSGLNLLYLSRGDKDEFKRLFLKCGKTRPFFISLDPTNEISDELKEFTKLVIFSDNPTYTHVKHEIFSVGFEFSEVV